MIEKLPLRPGRQRKIVGSFVFIEHRFLRDGFWSSLSQHALLLYLFLILVADRNGLLPTAMTKSVRCFAARSMTT